MEVTSDKKKAADAGHIGVESAGEPGVAYRIPRWYVEL
jgi:hypothetical protein